MPEVQTAQRAEVRIIDGIHWILVPDYEGHSNAHWHSLNGNRVRIHLPHVIGGEYMVMRCDSAEDPYDNTVRCEFFKDEVSAFKRGVELAHYIC